MTYTKDFDIGAAARRIKEKNLKLRAALDERRRRAQAFAREAAGILGCADDGVRKIIGFGSTFEEWRNYRGDSDIDLGLIGGDWSKLKNSEGPTTNSRRDRNSAASRPWLSA
jgi:hypothetical protein